MSDDIKKYRAILDGTNIKTSQKTRFVESVQKPAQMILENIRTQKFSKDVLLGAIINHPSICSNEQAAQVLREMSQQLKKKLLK